MRRYPPSTIYRYLDLPLIQIIPTHNKHRHNTTSQTLAQAAHPLPPPNIIHTTATKTQTHIPHSPHILKHVTCTRQTTCTTHIRTHRNDTSPDPTPALPSPSHPHILAAQTTLHMSQSLQQPHSQRIIIIIFI